MAQFHWLTTSVVIGFEKTDQRASVVIQKSDLLKFNVFKWPTLIPGSAVSNVNTKL